MNIFSKPNRDQVASLQAQVTAEAARADRAELQAAQFQQAAKDARIEAAQAKAQVAELESARVATTAKQVSIEASRMLAATGHVITEDRPHGHSDIWARYEAAKDKPKFWRENKDALLATSDKSNN